jgi:hypothetical protein
MTRFIEKHSDCIAHWTPFFLFFGVPTAFLFAAAFALRLIGMVSRALGLH